MTIEVQTRSEVNGIDHHRTLAAAMIASKEDATIWKISFQLDSGERVRLVREGFERWVYEPIILPKYE